jgi:hypothetical protein
VGRDDDVAGPPQGCGFVVGIRQNLEDEVSSTAGCAGWAQEAAYLMQVLGVHVAAPLVRGDGPSESS